MQFLSRSNGLMAAMLVPELTTVTRRSPRPLRAHSSFPGSALVALCQRLNEPLKSLLLVADQ